MAGNEDDRVRPEKTEEQMQKEAKEKEAKEQAQKEKDAKEQSRRDEESLLYANARYKFNLEKGRVFEFELVEAEMKGEKAVEKRTPIISQLNSPPDTQGNGAMLGDKNMLRLLPNGVYCLPDDPKYKFRLHDGRIKGVDLDKFGWGTAAFDNKKYCDAIFALHELRGDSVVTIEWDDVEFITEEKIRDAVDAAKKHGLEIEWGKNVTDFLRSDLEYKERGISKDPSAKLKVHFEKNNIGHEKGEQRRTALETLKNKTKAAREEREERMAPELDEQRVAKYLEDNKRHSKEIANQEKLPAPDDGEFDKKLNKTTNEADETKQKNEKLDNVQRELESAQARLKTLSSVEERLGQQSVFYEKKVEQAGGDTNKLDKVEKDMAGKNDEAKTGRESLIDAAKTEHADLTERVGVLKTKCGEIQSLLPESEQGRAKKMQENITKVQKELGDLKCKEPGALKRSFEEVGDKIKKKKEALKKVQPGGA